MINSFLNEGQFVYTIFEIAVLAAGIFYVIFALVVVKQVNKMTDTLEVGFEAPLRFFALLHLLMAIGNLIVSFLIL